MYTNNFIAVDGNIPRAVYLYCENVTIPCAVYLYCENVTISSESLSTVVVDVLLSPIEGCAIEPRGSVLPTVYYPKFRKLYDMAMLPTVLSSWQNLAQLILQLYCW